jgi:hypothetical protein
MGLIVVIEHILNLLKCVCACVYLVVCVCVCLVVCVFVFPYHQLVWIRHYKCDLFFGKKTDFLVFGARSYRDRDRDTSLTTAHRYDGYWRIR